MLTLLRTTAAVRLTQILAATGKRSPPPVGSARHIVALRRGSAAGHLTEVVSTLQALAATAARGEAANDASIALVLTDTSNQMGSRKGASSAAGCCR